MRTASAGRIRPSRSSIPPGVPILIGRDSNIAEDRPAPVVDPLDQSGMYDLSRGTVGELDPFIGAVEMPQGTYYVAVTSDRILAH